MSEMQISAARLLPPDLLSQTQSSARKTPSVTTLPLPPATESQASTENSSTKEKTDQKSVEAAAKIVESFISEQGNQLKFSVDQDLGQMVVKVIDPTTEEVLRQIPSEEMLSMAKALDQLKGLLVNNKA